MGLFDETGETPPNRDGRRPGSRKDTSLFDWLVSRAEADLGLAQAFAAVETQRADQIKRLEDTLVGQIAALQDQILERREAELNHLTSEISACADRLARIETAKAAGDATNEFVQDKLGLLRTQLSGLQTELENRHSGFERLGESLGAQIRALETHIRRELDGVGAVQAELCHLKSEAQSLTERVGQAESTAWQSRTLASRNAERLEQTAESLKGEIIVLKALCAELNEQHLNLPRPDALLQEIAHNLSAKIEGILGQLAQDDQAQIERDARLGHLDSGLAMLAERVKNTESLSRAAQALAQNEADSASDFRAQVAQELAALHTEVSGAQARLPAIEDLETTLRAKLDEWHQWSAQKFMLLENRDIEHEKSARDLETGLAAKLAEQEERTAESSGALASVHEKLLGLEPEMRALAQRIGQLESATRTAQGQADAGAMRAGQLEESFKSAMTGLRAEVAELAEQQRAFRLPDEQMCEIERKLGAKIDDLQRELAVEREGFDHWGKGLRESFGSELSAMQARLSERQSQIEYRYSRLEERLEETVKASIVDLEAKVNERLRPQDGDQERWGNLCSELGALGERANRFESEARQIEDRVTTTGQEFEKSLADLRAEIIAVQTTLEQRPATSSESVILGLETTLRANLCQLEERVAQKFTAYDSRDSERAERTEQSITGLRAELESLKAFLDQQQSSLPSAEGLAHAVEESLKSKILELDQKFADRFTAVDNRDLEGARRAHETVEALQTGIAALQGEMTALKAGMREGPETLADSAIRGLEESFGAKIQDLRQQLAQKLDLLDQRDTERTQQTERLIAGVTSEMTALKMDLSRPAVVTLDDPALRALEERLGVEIHELRQQVARNASLFESRDADLTELNERSQSLMQRVAQLSSAIPGAQSMGPAAIQSMPARPREVAAPEPETVDKTSESRAKAQAPSEKEQLIKLQERMSAEIERVRAELKERSGRWKVRKSAS